MPYTPPNTYTSGAAPGLDGPDLNAMNTQYTEAVNSLQPGLFTAFVQSSGLVATKDGTTASKLNITSGAAWVLQTDGTLRRRAVASASKTTSALSTTYYLDLNPDGTWSWDVAHSAVANYLAIAQVTTDASGNISTVTDARTLTTTLWSGLAGNLALPSMPKLAAGAQLTRDFVYESYHPDNTQHYGAWVPFPLDMSNTPSSITLTLSTTTNVTSANVVPQNLTKTGFFLSCQASAAGRVTVVGTYTTIGN